MFDASIITAMDHGVAFRPPAVIQEASDLRSDLAGYRASMWRQLGRIERAVDDWVRRGEEARTRPWSEVQAHGLDLDRIAALELVVGAIENRVAEEAKEFRRHEKAFEKQVLLARSISPQAAAITRETAEQALKLMAREGAERVEFGLFLRALLGLGQPGSAGGPVFAEPRDMERYLHSALA